MKKVLALVLAGVMAASMSVMAFAADETAGVSVTPTEDNVAEAAVQFATSLVDEDGNTPEYKPGDTFYLRVTGKDDAVITKLATITDDYRLSIDDDSDKNLFVSAKLILKKIYDKKEAFVEIVTKDNFVEDDQALDLIITLNPKKTTSKKAEVAVAGTMNYGVTEDVSKYYTVKSGFVNFEDIDDDVELYFGDDGDIEFHVNSKSDKTLFLRYNDDEDDAIVEKFGDASLEFHYFEGNKDTFKKEGTLYIPADEGSFIYEIVDGKVTAIEGAKYDDAKEMWTVKTKTLGNYIVSDKELVAAEGEGETGTDAETNPDTGANDFVGLAVALAVVSVAGIAVAKRK
ncbi:acid shock protein [Ligaoa zhengdingensis]|uniref:acid shock protein n=1 Tax=Ligaoa zhengdingensis TaxID=2763658 RepID=UPI0031BB2B33